MTRLIVVAAASVGLILFVTFVAVRLIRSRARGMSVRLQVFLALAMIVGAFAFGLGLLVIDRVDARAERLALDAAQDESRAVAAILQSELVSDDRSFPELARQLERWHPTAPTSPIDTMGLELVTPEGHVLFPAGSASRARELGAVYVDTPLTIEKKTVGIVRVVKPTIVIQAMLADFAPTVLVISLLLGAVAALAAAWIGRTIAAPIEALSTFSEDVAAGERTTLPTRVAGREVARLVTSIDAMRRQLEGRPFVETFAADLSHELKNPVAAIRASAEVLQDGALEEPEQAQRFVERIREAAERIDRLLGELLGLARVETQGVQQLTQVDVAALVRDSVATLAEDATRLELNIEEKCWVRGDERWLGRATFNLLDNALHHSSSECQVQVRLQRTDEHVLLTVINPGQVSKHVRSQLFKRFVTTRANKGGTGLGLAIVRAVAEAHGGQVKLEAPGPPDVVFHLSLPAA